MSDTPMMSWSEPVTGRLALLDAGGPVGLDEARRRALREQLAAGTLDRLSFVATTFRAVYPNASDSQVVCQNTSIG